MVEALKKVRHVPYASMMVTDNVRTIAKLLAQGYHEKQGLYYRQAADVAYIVISFLIGVALATAIIPYAEKYSLYPTLPPSFISIASSIKKEKFNLKLYYPSKNTETQAVFKLKITNLQLQHFFDIILKAVKRRIMCQIQMQQTAYS